MNPKWKCKTCGGTSWSVQEYTPGFLDQATYLHLDCDTEGCKSRWRHTVELSHWPQPINTGEITYE